MFPSGKSRNDITENFPFLMSDGVRGILSALVKVIIETICYFIRFKIFKNKNQEIYFKKIIASY